MHAALLTAACYIDFRFRNFISLGLSRMRLPPPPLCRCPTRRALQVSALLCLCFLCADDLRGPLSSLWGSSIGSLACSSAHASLRKGKERQRTREAKLKVASARRCQHERWRYSQLYSQWKLRGIRHSLVLWLLIGSPRRQCVSRCLELARTLGWRARMRAISELKTNEPTASDRRAADLSKHRQARTANEISQ